MIRKSRIVACGVLMFVLCQQLLAQQIPLGTWRMHASFNAIKSIAPANGLIYAAAESGVMVFDQSDNSVSAFTRNNGMAGSGIRAIAYDAPRDQLLITYADGTIDIIHENSVTSFDRLKTSTTITGSKQLNFIEVRNDLAYIPADFGLVVFDLKSLEVKETWRDLGPSGDRIKIFQCTFLGDSIFLATEKGVLAGRLSDNLLDFNQWKRTNTGEFNSNVRSITSYDGHVYAAINGAGVFRNDDGTWVKETYLQGQSFQSLNGLDDFLYIAQGENLWRVTTAGLPEEIESPFITRPVTVVQDNGKLWIGDSNNGLLSGTASALQPIRANGPSTDFLTRVKFSNAKLNALAGGPSLTFIPLNNAGIVNEFQSGAWTQVPDEMKDLTDTDFIFQKTFLSSFGYGLEATDAAGDVIRYDELNSPLVNVNPPGRFVEVTAIQSSDAGLWVTNYGAAKPLHLLKSDGTWESFSFPYLAARYPTDIAVDLYGSVWMVLNPAQGGGVLVFSKDRNAYTLLTEVAGAGGLPARAARSVAVDRDGYVWIGTDVGVGYFIDPYNIFTGSVDIIKPIYESRFLLRDDRVTSIVVDAGNRKWMGTERGVWLFGPAGESVVHNFTIDNSPLPSDVIRSMDVEATTGEVFFATANGMVSYRSDATSSENFFQTVKIFPNPVDNTFSGTIGISGLATDAIVKITDVSGKLIWQTRANGGTATWNRQDYTGRRAATGVYLVFAASPDGVESVVGKIAVIE